jgi:hypothetical protein
VRLPTPTAPNIDVTAERLREVDRQYDAAPKGVNFGGAVAAGIETADALAERFAKMDTRQKAAEFQKVLDTGWAGAEEAIEAAEIDEAAKARIRRLKTGDPKIDAQVLPLVYQDLAKEIEKAAADTVSAQYEALLADPESTPEQRDQVLAKLGRLTGNRYQAAKDIEAGRRTAEQKEADRVARAEIAEEKARIARLNLKIKQAKESGGLKPGEMRLFNDLEKRILETQLNIERLRAIKYPDDQQKSELAHDQARLRRMETEFDNLIKKGAVSGGGKAEAPPPVTDGPPKAYPDARKGKDNGWYIPDPKRPGKYLKVG